MIRIGVGLGGCPASASRKGKVTDSPPRPQGMGGWRARTSAPQGRRFKNGRGIKIFILLGSIGPSSSGAYRPPYCACQKFKTRLYKVDIEVDSPQTALTNSTYLCRADLSTSGWTPLFLVAAQCLCCPIIPSFHTSIISDRRNFATRS